MLLSDKVQSSDEGKINLKQAYKEAKLTQEELAAKSQCFG
jgi:DNA-binding XRE family transcriptional regulator